MKVEKANWQSDGNHVSINMPIAKVDVEKRLVSGFATMDNPDRHGDVVTAEASATAFAQFRGNIREMHQPIAVGKLADMKEDEYYDPTDGKFYKGVFVTAYISTGAQSTWEKVLDGTLTGFSIGGDIEEATSEYIPELKKSVRFIKKYNLYELSLVDNPANQFANVYTIVKMSDGAATGVLADTQIENVFYCNEDNIAKTSSEESASCTGCGQDMQNIGWVEVNDAKAEAVQKVIDQHVEQAAPVENEGGVNVADEVKDSPAEAPVEAAEEGKAATEVPEVESPAEGEAVEAPAAEDVSEVEGVEPDLEKMFGDLKETLKKGLEDSRSEVTGVVEEVKSRFDEVTKSLETELENLKKSYSELSEKFDAVKTNVESVEKRLGSVESDSAVKKSGDLGGSAEPVTKDISGGWGGHFLSVNSLQD